jgi:hypothetical protein
MYADRAAAYRRAVNKGEWELVWFMEVDAQATCVESNRRFQVLTHGTGSIEDLRQSVLEDMARLQEA